MNSSDKPQEHRSTRRKKFGECLVEAGLIDKETLAKALDIQKIQKKKLGQIIIDMGMADDVEIAKALSRQFNIPLINPTGMEISKEIISLVPSAMAENYMVIPIKKTDRGLLVAMSNPLDIYALDDLRFVTQMSIDVAVASYDEMLAAVEKYYPKRDLEKDLDSGPKIDEGIEIVQRKGKEDEDLKDIQKIINLTQRPPVIRFTNAILADAIKLKSSDIHIEPQKTSVIIRYRIDGIMREIMQTDKHIHASLVSRIKIISNMDISIRRKPQDGKSQVKYKGVSYDMRVSTIPTSYGEKVTIRILNPATSGLNIKDLGLSDNAFEKFDRAINMPQGIILITGPTGSGKSSTLYACLNKLNTVNVNIITVEDPIEFDIAGVNQVQINPKVGITFAAGLRSILRQDPDIVMVGEIRDGETASIAFQAAQTGHLVLSTLHTNDATAAVTRLLDLGVEPFLVSSSLVMVVGQRLLRKICKKCKIPDSTSPQIMKRLSSHVGTNKKATFWKGDGCEACNYTGYSGRMGLFEVLAVTPSLKEAIEPNVSAITLKKIAEREGFESMSMDGIQKALHGLTTIDEVFRVAPPGFDDIIQKPILEISESDKIETAEQASEDMPSSSISIIKSKRILVVDDNAIIVKIVGNLLESEGYIVLTAENGLEAMKLAFQSKPDLIITDLLMPEMDGVTLIKKLRAQLSTRYIPIIMLTVKDEVDVEVKSIDAGADDYLIKPVNPKKLVSRVNRLLNRPPAT
ncbi:MAG: ATPase, T2SS/T4P/T4SS family [Desulfobacterales bacterium]|nr:ATPase, T2SS/T4P/T4SS family [Desulfobacterales bacterium]